MHRQQVVSEEQTAMMAKVPTQLEVSSSGEARFILGFVITSELFLLVFGVISRPKLKRVLEMDNSKKIEPYVGVNKDSTMIEQNDCYLIIG